MVDHKKDRRPVTVYLDHSHQDWWDTLPNNSRSDMFNALIENYRHNVDGTKDTIDKASLTIASNKSKGPLSERFFLRLSKSMVEAFEAAASKQGLSVPDWVREVCWRYAQITNANK